VNGSRWIERVLVIDDDERALRAWQRALRLDGRDVRVAQSLATAELEMAWRPQLVVVDQCLGGGERGIDVIQHLKQIDSTICAILVSASMTIPQAVAAVHAGAHDCDVKPLDPRRLLARIEFGSSDAAPDHVLTLAEVEFEHIARVMDDCAGNISHAARALRLHRQSLQRKLRRDRPTSEEADPPPLSEPMTSSRRAS
jgi:two-component system response regulator RegA